MSGLDIGIVVLFFAGIIGAGWYLRKKASGSIEDYFLGGRKIPWWALGASGSASNFDLTGTMVVVSFLFLMGFEGFWVTMRGGVGLPLAFLLVFMGKWIRRSGVMTNAEWMQFRFGNTPGGRFARTVSAVANLAFSLGMVIYFCVGTGKFFEVLTGYPKEVCSVVMISIALVYTVLSGLYGVIFTDLAQEALLILLAVYFGVEAFVYAGQVDLPARFTDLSFPTTVNLAAYPEYEMFTYCVVFWALKGILEGFGGLGGYMAQRYLATANEKEASLMTAEWILLLGFRWMLIMAIAILGLKVAESLAVGQVFDTEQILPAVIAGLPTGIKGIALAGFIAAAMSTFDSTVNAGAAYWVKDIYQFRLKPDATEKQMVHMGHLASIVITVVGVTISFTVPSIDAIWSFIVASLTAGMFVPLCLRWYWARFTGYGYGFATLSGLISSLALEVWVKPHFVYEVAGETVNRLPPYLSFAIVAAIALVVGVVVSLLTQPASDKVLDAFYRKTRVGGLWGSVRNRMGNRFADFVKAENRRAIIGVMAALPGQLCYFLAIMAFVTHQWHLFVPTFLIAATSTTILYFVWYRHLDATPPVEGTQ